MRTWLLRSLTLTLLLAACGAPTPAPRAVVETVPAGQDGPVYFLRQPPARGQRAYMTALLIGKLTVRDGCLRAGSPCSGDEYLLIWPEDFSPAVREGAIEIHDGQGQVVGQVGEYITMGGGEGGADNPAIRAGTGGCAGPYWIVGTGVQLYTWDAAQPVTAIDPGTQDQPLYLLRWTPAIESWLAEAAQVEGQLAWEEGCLRLQAADGQAPLTLLWPPDYALSGEEGPPGIVDGRGVLLARVGERVSLPGREISTGRAPVEAEMLRAKLPARCGAPYWMVACP